MCYKEVVSLLHELSVVDFTKVSVVMDRHVVSSVGKRVTSLKSALRKSKVVEILAIEPNLHQLLHNTGLYLEEPLLA